MKQRSAIGRTGFRFAVVLAVCLLWTAAPVQGRILPCRTVQEMCVTADMIVAGTHIGDGKVRIDRVFYPLPAMTEAPETVQVPSIPEHSRIIGSAFVKGEDVARVTTDRLVLFLREAEDGTFAPIDMIGKGSQGLIWCEDEACYGYEPVMGGTYYLVRSKRSAHPGRVPRSRDALYEHILLGIEFRSRWEVIETIKDPDARARRMAAYLLPRTAPRGYEQSLDLRKAIRKIGPPAVPALVEVLEKAEPEDDLHMAVLTLYDTGCTHPEALRPAVPALCKLLANPGPNSPYYILSPLKAAGDPRAIPHVRPMLKHAGKQVRGQAARALAAMKDLGSFDAIAALIEEPPSARDRLGYTLELVRSLFELDPVRARPIIERIESAQGNAGLHHFIDGFD